MLGAMASIPLPVGPAAATPLGVDPLQTELLDRFRIDVPVFTWPERSAASRRWVRISAQAYNRSDHYLRLAEALRELAGAGAGGVTGRGPDGTS